ncbi:MAG: GNAT family N-acetyltransferase [Heliomarina sp.]|uniref:GNAT family N-acetyltransferase n=1 Tax=Heliomarina sp. TaxID=2917556 RepID=UPI004059AD39
MDLQIEDIRSKTCLYGFKCGVSELEKFAKKAFRSHTRETPDYRVRCLYDLDAPSASALGYYSLSIKIPQNGEMPVGERTIYTGDRAFLYIDHLAVRNEEKKKGYSSWLMVDLLDAADQFMRRFGRIDYLSLNAADSDAHNFFRDKWGFTQVTSEAHPLLVLERQRVIEVMEEIARRAEGSGG